LLQLEAVLAVIEKLGDRRLSRFAYQDEIKVFLSGATQCVSRLDYADLLTIGRDTSLLPHPDLLIPLQFLRYVLHLHVVEARCSRAVPDDTHSDEVEQMNRAGTKVACLAR